TPFKGLAVNHWYRVSAVFDFTTNAVVSYSITDTAVGSTTHTSYPGIFLQGGLNNTGGSSLPTAFRFFVGGGPLTAGGPPVPGNISGFDNLALAHTTIPVLRKVSGTILPDPAAGVANFPAGFQVELEYRFKDGTKVGGFAVLDASGNFATMIPD